MKALLFAYFSICLKFKIVKCTTCFEFFVFVLILFFRKSRVKAQPLKRPTLF